jgi:hypothetical protein
MIHPPVRGEPFPLEQDDCLAQQATTHYVMRVSNGITSEMQSFHPKCVNIRPKMLSGGYPWESWFPETQVQNGVYFTLCVRPESVHCSMKLANGCKKEWQSLSESLDFLSGVGRIKKVLIKINDQAHIPLVLPDLIPWLLY